MNNAMAMKAERLNGEPGERRWSDVAALYERHAPRLFRLAYWALLGDSRVAAEVLRLAFVRCAEAAGAGEPGDRAGRRLERISVRALRDSLGEPETGGAAVTMGIARLLPDERLAFLLHDGAGYPLERCAELLELAPPECRRLLFAARLRLCQTGGVCRLLPAA